MSQKPCKLLSCRLFRVTRASLVVWLICQLASPLNRDWGIAGRLESVSALAIPAHRNPDENVGPESRRGGLCFRLPPHPRESHGGSGFRSSARACPKVMNSRFASRNRRRETYSNVAPVHDAVDLRVAQQGPIITVEAGDEADVGAEALRIIQRAPVSLIYTSAFGRSRATERLCCRSLASKTHISFALPVSALVSRPPSSF